MSLECQSIDTKVICQLSQPKQQGEGEALIVQLEKDPSQLAINQKLKKYCQTRADQLIWHAERSKAKPIGYLLAAKAQLLKYDTTNTFELLVKAAGYLQRIPACCFVGTKSFLAGEIFFRQGDWTNASEAYQKSLAEHPRAFLALYRLMIINMVQEDFARALDYANQLPVNDYNVVTAKSLPDLSIFRARIILGVLNPSYGPDSSIAEAEIAGDKMIDKASLNYQVVEAELLLSKYYFMSAKGKLEAVLAKDPKQVYAAYVLGCAYQKRTQYSLAEQYLSQAVRTAQQSNDPVFKKYGQQAIKRLSEITDIKRRLTDILAHPKKH